MNLLEWLNDNSGAVQAIAVVVLVVVTSLYWWAARQQAKASVKMAQEMRDQRLAEDQPYILLELLAQQWETNEIPLAEPKGRTIADLWPQTVKLQFTNVGRGPAKHVEVRLLHPKVVFWRSHKDRLLLGETWEEELSEASIVLPGETPLRLSDWLQREQAQLEYSGSPNMAAVVIYEDLHDRRWATYLELHYETDVSSAGPDDYEAVLSCWVSPGNQRIVRLLRPHDP